MAEAQVEVKASHVLIKSHYEQATKCIHKGITCDETGDEQQANNHYNKALRSINVGLATKCEGQNGQDIKKLKEIQEKLKKLKIQVEERLEVLHSKSSKKTAPARPPPPIKMDSQHRTPHNYIPPERDNPNCSNLQTWEDAQELLSIRDGVTMFFVSEQGHVTTLYQPQTIRALQLLNDTEGSGDAGAFLHCGSWVFPLIPGRSPVLKTEERTFMIPDINLDDHETSTSARELVQGKFPTVGLVFSKDISEDKIKRFERILKCYADYRQYTPPASLPTETNEAETRLPSAALGPEQTTERALIPTGDRTLSENEEQSQTWGSKVSKGIEVGAVIISWGLSKGAELGGNLINQGSEKLRGKIKPNEESAKIDPKIEENIRQIKTATGVACQVSSAIVSAVSALTRELGKQLAPVIVEQGTKLLPASAKRDDSKGKNHIQEVVKVAVGGVQGESSRKVAGQRLKQLDYSHLYVIDQEIFAEITPVTNGDIVNLYHARFAVVHEGLTNAWKILYSSLSQATVTTVDHKYGEQAGRITGDAMGAVGNTIEAYHNVNHLGYNGVPFIL